MLQGTHSAWHFEPKNEFCQKAVCCLAQKKVEKRVPKFRKLQLFFQWIMSLVHRIKRHWNDQWPWSNKSHTILLSGLMEALSHLRYRIWRVSRSWHGSNSSNIKSSNEPFSESWPKLPMPNDIDIHIHIYRDLFYKHKCTVISNNANVLHIQM